MASCQQALALGGKSQWQWWKGQKGQDGSKDAVSGGKGGGRGGSSKRMERQQTLAVQELEQAASTNKCERSSLPMGSSVEALVGQLLGEDPWRFSDAVAACSRSSAATSRTTASIRCTRSSHFMVTCHLWKPGSYQS